eukprot:1423567-Amphidinium_carterae.1
MCAQPCTVQGPPSAVCCVGRPGFSSREPQTGQKSARDYGPKQTGAHAGGGIYVTGHRRSGSSPSIPGVNAPHLYHAPLMS